MRFKAGWIALVLALVAVAAGCGGNKSATGTTSSATTTAATTTSAASSSGGGATTTASSGGTGAPSFASSKNCLQLASIGAKFSQAMAAATSSGKSSVTSAAEAYQALADAAPSAIRSDLETLSGAFESFAKALEKAGYTPGKTPTAAQLAALSSASKSFTSPKLQAAEQHLVAWGKKNCSG